MLLIISTRTTLPCSRLVHHDAVKPPITEPGWGVAPFQVLAPHWK
jgi:hypothetical protein